MLRQSFFEVANWWPRKLRTLFATGEKRLFLKPDSVASFPAYLARSKAMEAEHSRRAGLEAALAASQEPFETPGFCFVCDRRVSFLTDFLFSGEPISGKKLPNWRERVTCASCGLNNRMRASIHVIEEILRTRRSSRIYLGERVTPFYAALERRFNCVVGSEYLGNKIPFGEFDANGIRNESITQLTFGNGSFDVVLSFDVLEHIPDPKQGIHEIFRVLVPGGKVALSVPFLIWQQNTQTRAVLEAGGVIRHLLPPLYHDDPLNPSGCLCFQEFGWDLLDQMRSAGFKKVAMILYWSEEFGYYGIEQGLIVGEKPKE